MPTDSLPKINYLHTSSDLVQTKVLDLLFEPSSSIHSTLLPVIRTAVYSSYSDLIDVCQIRLLSLAASSATSEPNPILLDVLGSHPKLGERDNVSPVSAAEQESLKVEDDDDRLLATLNEEYDEKFPGLRYVVFVNGRPRNVILEDMRERIDRGDYTKEVAALIQAMCDIAKDRAMKLFGEKPAGQ